MTVATHAMRPIDVHDLVVIVLKLPVFNSLMDLIPAKLAKELKLFHAHLFAGFSHYHPHLVNVILNTSEHFLAPGFISMDLDGLFVHHLMPV